MSVIPLFKELRQEDSYFETSLDKLVRLCLEIKIKKAEDVVEHLPTMHEAQF